MARLTFVVKYMRVDKEVTVSSTDFEAFKLIVEGIQRDFPNRTLYFFTVIDHNQKPKG